MSFISQIFGYPLGYLMQGCYFLANNYGIALLLFALATRILLFPLAIKQQKSTAQMAVFKPKMDEIQKKFANDKKRQQEEQMKLYEEYNYNPAGGCLPMLIQFPILFGLIDVVYKPLTHIARIPSEMIDKGLEVAKNIGVEISTINPQVSLITAVKGDPAAFGVFNAEQISKIQSIDFSFFGLDLAIKPELASLLIIIPILSGITMILNSLLSMKFSGTGSAMGGGSKVTLITMSAFSLIFAFQVPAAVGLYWTYSNIILIGQSFLLHKIYSPEKLSVEFEERMKAVEESKKKKVKVKVQDEKGGTKEVEKVLSDREVNRLRLAKARELDNAKYGEEE